MNCRISRFQDGGSFQLDPLVTNCRLRILRKIVTNQILRYKVHFEVCLSIHFVLH